MINFDQLNSWTSLNHTSSSVPNENTDASPSIATVYGARMSAL